jgi:low temperature requirement protein LtrA
LKRWRSILEVGISIQITTGEDLDSFPNLILVLIYFCSLFFIVAFLYWCYWHKLDSLNKLCATMKQEQLYWQYSQFHIYPHDSWKL